MASGTDDGTDYDNVEYATIEIKAAGNVENEEGALVTHNGYYEVSFDPEKAVFAGVDTDLEFCAHSLDSEEGVFRFAFADIDGVAEGGTVATLMFTVFTDEDSVISVKTIESEDDFNGSEEQYDFGPRKDITVHAYPENTLANAYYVEGSVVTVRFDKPCKVGYLSGDKYVAVAAVANEDGSYSFTAEEGVEEVILVIKGDVTEDGRLNSSDTSLLQRYVLQKANIDSIQFFAGDMNSDGRVNTADVSQLNRIVLNPTRNAW